MSKHVRVSELDFGLEMLVYDSKSIYPLEAASSVEFTDDKGVFYAPIIPDYVTGIEKITGSLDGYNTRQELLSCVGRCWDLAVEHINNQGKN
ncbi:MAG: hypothetical protein HRT50_11630 [Colwellia sp.]|uniref:hypothetical protein n=1 Tax=Colwellia sp. TaxID=56799 RepID=UPI001DFF7898|nr:hypothetical protein [Colwellia sp.]NQY49730.1 hypothetical protein [Colwellia sp.]